jgi:hypothetical protein
MVRHTGWRKAIDTAVEEAKAAKGNEANRSDVSDRIAVMHPTWHRAAVAKQVYRYVGLDPKGGVELRPKPLQTRDRRGATPAPVPSADPAPTVLSSTSPPVAGEFRPEVVQSSTSNPVKIPADVLQELEYVRRSPFWKRMAEEGKLRKALRSK